MNGYFTRLFSIELRELKGIDAYPILPSPFFAKEAEDANKNDIIRISLNSMPIPDESTTWEQIFEFRDDPDSKDKFLDLRNWMSEVARENLTIDEIIEKLEYLMSRYRRHMALHKMKFNVGTLETVIVTTGEILEGLAHFRFGEAAKALFSFKHRQIELLEGELTSAGSEVAYIIKARETF